MDIGFGAIRRMLEANIDYRQIDMVIVSHNHPDHVSDLVPLIMALQFTPNFDRTKPLCLYGPRGFSAFMAGLGDLYGKWVLQPDLFQVCIHELDSETISMDGWILKTLPMNHGRVTNGYRFELGDKSVSYSGDTGFCQEVIDLFRDVDLGVLECSFPDNLMVEGHLTPKLAGEIAEKAKCKKLILSHFYPIMENIDSLGICQQYYSGNIEKAYDLMELDI
jgi:ribonuclease BN (tRNA processing enzyme)